LEPATIEFVGELTIQSVGEARERLLSAFAETASVTADIQPDATVDLSFLQLIEAARRTARESGLAFGLGRPAEGQLLQALERGGFLAAAEQREFWLMQTEGR
jgi:hypothetical protein